MNIMIISWILQVIVAVFFVKPALNNLFKSKEQLVGMHQLKPGKPATFNRFLGLCQALGVIGLIVPRLLDIYPVLTAWAALGFCIMMIAAIFIHKNDKDKKLLMIVSLMAILSLAIFVLNK